MGPTASAGCQVSAVWGQRHVVDDRTGQARRVYLVDLAAGDCTCQRPDCEHLAAVRQMDAKRAAVLDRVTADGGARQCPRCHHWTLFHLDSNLLAVTVCEHCGYGRVAYPQARQPNGPGGRRARTAIRYL